MQLAFYSNCPTVEEASIYSAFAQNAAMSAMFLGQLFFRKDTKAQSVTIGIAKCIGTLAPTIYGQISSSKLSNYILTTGILCSLLDLIYLFLLVKKKRSEQQKNN
jgi:hypothetical protein